MIVAQSAAAAAIDVAGLTLDLPVPPGHCALSPDHPVDGPALAGLARGTQPVGLLLQVSTRCETLELARQGAALPASEWAYWFAMDLNGAPRPYRGTRLNYGKAVEPGIDRLVADVAARTATAKTPPAAGTTLHSVRKLGLNERGLFVSKVQRTVTQDGAIADEVFAMGHTVVADRALLYQVSALATSDKTEQELYRAVAAGVDTAIANNGRFEKAHGLTGEFRQKFVTAAQAQCKGSAENVAWCRCGADTMADWLDQDDVGPTGDIVIPEDSMQGLLMSALADCYARGQGRR